MRSEFEAAGYVSLPGFLSSTEVEEWRQEWARVRQSVVPELADAEVYYEEPADPRSLKQVQQLWKHDSWFHERMVSGPFRSLAEELLGESVVPINLQYFNKPAGTSRATPPHQDGHYFPIEPKRALTMWLALDDVASGQGCLRYVHASHKDGLRKHEPSGTLGFSQSIPDYGTRGESEREVELPCRAGHLCVHHALTIHRADANGSPAPSREALGFIYYGESCRVDTRAGERYQEGLAERLRSGGRI